MLNSSFSELQTHAKKHKSSATSWGNIWWYLNPSQILDMWTRSFESPAGAQGRSGYHLVHCKISFCIQIVNNSRINQVDIHLFVFQQNTAQRNRGGIFSYWLTTIAFHAGIVRGKGNNAHTHTQTKTETSHGCSQKGWSGIFKQLTMYLPLNS